MKNSKPEDMVFAMIAGSATLAVGTAFVLLMYQAIALAPLVDSMLVRSVTMSRPQ